MEILFMVLQLLNLRKMRYYCLLACFTVLFSGCFETTNEIPVELTLSENSMTFAPAGGEQTITIQSNTKNWIISSNASAWLSVSPASGIKNGEIKVTASVNNTSFARSATITTSGTGIQDISINVTQTADSNVFGNDITAANNFGGGNGTKNNPFLIQNAAHLKKLVVDVNNGNSFVDNYISLMTDIVVTADEWIPIGSWIGSGSSFKGFFDGNNHSISGTLKSSRFQSFGFFGVIRESALITNLTIAAKVINEGDFTSHSVTNDTYTGAITGMSGYENITINNCSITGSVTGGIANRSYTGGIIGLVGGVEITDCNVVNNTITGGSANRSYTGGIAGSINDGMIQACTLSNNTILGGKGDNDGLSLTGGIVGSFFEGLITNCTIVSSTRITGGDTNQIGYCRTGGIAGDNQAQIMLCTNHASVSGNGLAGGIAGTNYGTIHQSLNTGSISGNSKYTGGLAGLNDYDERYDNYLNEGYIYPCCTNIGTVNSQAANSNNQIGIGKAVESTCPDGHTKR